MAVLLIGTLDTKGAEFAVRPRPAARRPASRRWSSTPACCGRRAFAPDIAARAGLRRRRHQRSPPSQQAGDRGQAVEAAARGAAEARRSTCTPRARSTASSAWAARPGTTIGTAAMRALPFGVPKLMVSTLASGQVRPYVGVRDILMMHSVVDISGLNRISRTVLTNAAEAMAGMVQASGRQRARPSRSDKPLITATMFGVTTPCVEAAREQLEAARLRGARLPRHRHRRHDDGVVHRATA